MIFSLTDETYSVLCSTEYPAYVDKGQCMFYIALLDHIYWIVGSVIGAAAGALIPFDFKGIDFSMTALFVIILLEQWKSAKSHILIVFGADSFILPSLVLTVLVLLALKKPLEKAAERSGGM